MAICIWKSNYNQRLRRANITIIIDIVITGIIIIGFYYYCYHIKMEALNFPISVLDVILH